MKLNTNLLSGTAMSVLSGVVLVIAPWTFESGETSTKILLLIFGFVLIYLGVRFSKG